MRVLLAPTHDDAFEPLQLLDRRNVTRAVIALSDAGLIETIVADRRAASKGNQINRIKRISPDAQRLVGLWPTPESALDRMIASLQADRSHQHRPRRVRARPARSSTSCSAADETSGWPSWRLPSTCRWASAAVEAAATPGRIRRGRFPASAGPSSPPRDHRVAREARGRVVLHPHLPVGDERDRRSS